MATPKPKPDPADVAPDPDDVAAAPEQPDDAVAAEPADVPGDHRTTPDPNPPSPVAPPPMVVARFVDVQSVLSPSQGLIGYGDPFEVTAEQLAHDPRLIAWSDDWTPDPAALAAANLEG